jgi:hypothetical protein
VSGEHGFTANAEVRLIEWWLNVAALVGRLHSTIFVLSFARLSRIT